MHEQWQTLIPYYVAGSLSAQEAASLEHHLAECAVCNTAFQEWSQIAGVVRTEADAWSKPLPPLAQRVRENLDAPAIRSNGYKANSLPSDPDYRVSYRNPRGQRSGKRAGPTTGRARSIMTLAAVLLMIVFFGVVLLLMSRSGSNEQYLGMGPDDAAQPQETGIDPLPSRTPLASVSPTLTPAFIGTGRPTEAGTRDLGIITFHTPTPIATPVLNVTADPNRCAVYSQVDTAVPVYTTPFVSQSVSTMLAANEFMYTWVQSGTGWYQVGRPGQGIQGWIQASQVRLSGACSNLPVPTATTPPTTTTECRAAASGQFTVNLRSGPGETYEMINGFGPQTSVPVLKFSDNNWYQVRLVIWMSDWIGWVSAEQVNLIGQCNNLPVVSSANYPPEATPVYAITPTAPFEFGAGYNLMTIQAVGPFAANTLVRISHAYYNNQEWVYFVVAKDEITTGEVLERYLTYAPGYNPGQPTPVALFQSDIGMGQYNLITLSQLGNMPANTRVRISYAWYDGEDWYYRVVAQDEILFADAPQTRLSYLPGYTPGPTPTYTPVMPPQIGYFRADHDVIVRGGSVVLEWEVYGVQMALVELYDDAISPTDPLTVNAYLPTTGSLTVPIQPSYVGDTVRFTLSAANDGPGDFQRLAQTSINIPVVDAGDCEPPFYYQDSDRQSCPIQMETTTDQAAIQTFEHGTMLWRADGGQILVLKDDNTVWIYNEADYAGMPDNPVTDSPPQGLYKPVSGFGRVWGNFPVVRQALGWALQPEQGYTMGIQYSTTPAITYRYLTFPEGGTVVRINANYTWSYFTP